MKESKSLVNGMFPVGWEARFRESILREVMVLVAMILLDMLSSIIMMKIIGAKFEANLSFQRLYIEPNLTNAFTFIGGQSTFILLIVASVLLALIPLKAKVWIASKRYGRYALDQISYIEHFCLIGFAVIRFYGSITNVAAILTELTPNFTVMLLSFFMFAGFLFIMKCTVIRNMKVYRYYVVSQKSEQSNGRCF